MASDNNVCRLLPYVSEEVTRQSSCRKGHYHDKEYFAPSDLAFLIGIEYLAMIMEPKPHMRKIEVSLSEAEEITLKSLKRMHPEWVRKNGDCPECVGLQHQMADTTRPESVAAAMEDSYPDLDS